MKSNQIYFKSFPIFKIIMRKYLISLILISSSLCSQAQRTYSIDASTGDTTIKTGLLRMGSPGLRGQELGVNNRYLTLNGKPIFPVMGEVHYSRIPRSQWEDVVLKMKAFGHFVIAMVFIGVLRDPVRNRWLFDFGLLACVLVIPYAFVFGGLRGIPVWWRLIDCSFGVFGFLPLWFCRRWALELERLPCDKSMCGK